MYQSVWLAVVGEQLACAREPTNTSDVHAVAVLKSGTIIGHLPRKISTLCSIFLGGGSIHCVVTGRRRCSSDLPQGGMEIPCSLHFKGAAKYLKKVKKLFNCKSKVEPTILVIHSIQTVAGQILFVPVGLCTPESVH